MATLYSKIEQEMECPMGIVVWNYFDHEHVVGTHYKSYESIRVLAEQDNWCFAERYFKLPMIPFKVTSRNFSVMTDAHHMKSIHIGLFGSTYIQDYEFVEIDSGRCKVILESRIEVPAIVHFFLKPFFEKFTVKWFFGTWDEDHPMRLRRWKVWNLGFKNFQGIDYINKKTAKPEGLGNENRPYPVELPVPKSTPICREGYKRPFKKNTEIGYGMPVLQP